MRILVDVVRFLAGGALVCLFALISDIYRPKRFSGLFSAAPSVLVAGVAVTLVAERAGEAVLTAEGAIAGALGMIAYCLVAVPLIRRFKALAGSALALGVWLAVALCAYAVIAKVVGP